MRAVETRTAVDRVPWDRDAEGDGTLEPANPAAVSCLRLTKHFGAVRAVGAILQEQLRRAHQRSLLKSAVEVVIGLLNFVQDAAPVGSGFARSHGVQEANRSARRHHILQQRNERVEHICRYIGLSD